MSKGGRRLFNVANVTVVLVVLALAGLLTWLLVRTMNAADAVSHDAERIARIGHGINIATDSVVQLQRTNDTARSILHHVRPVHQQLQRIVGLSQAVNGTAAGIQGTAVSIEGDARTIDTTAGRIVGTANSIQGTARSIDSTARNIDATAGHIDGTAKTIDGHAVRIYQVAGGINQAAAHILTRARRIDRDVHLINLHLNDSIGLARTIVQATGNILFHVTVTHHYAACIDQEVAGRNGLDEHCETLPAGQVAHGGGGSGS